MNARKFLALALALVMCLSLLPAPALAVEGSTQLNIKDTSKNYAVYTQLAGLVRDLEDPSKTQVLNYTVPDDGVTVLLFFKASGVCMNSNKIMDEIGRTNWAKNEKVNIVAVEVDGVDRDTTQSYIDSHDTAGVIDHVYYGNNTIACWFAKLIDNNGNMDGVTNWSVSLGFGYAIVVTKEADGNYIRYSIPNLVSAEELTAFVGEFVDISEDEGDIEDYTSLYTTTIRDPKWDYGPVAEELDLLNEYRSSKGLGEVAFDATMQRAAMKRAAEIAVYYSHTLPDHTPKSTPYAENIGAGYFTAAAAMEGWIGSEGHRRNIETPSFQSVGLGCFTASDGTMYWVQLFSDAVPAEESIKIAGPYECEIIVARKFLDLNVAPAAVNLEVGKTEAVTLKNTNQGFLSGVSKIYATYWNTQNPAVATVKKGSDGTVTVTAVGAGKTTIQVGLEPAVVGIEPIVVDIPVTVTAAAAPSVNPGTKPSTRPSPSTEPSESPSTNPSESPEPSESPSESPSTNPSENPSAPPRPSQEPSGPRPTPSESKLTLNKSAVSVQAGQTASITATVSGPEDKNIYAISADTSVATVSVSDKNITVKGMAVGNTSVYVIMSDVNAVTLADVMADPGMQEINVTVTAPSSSSGGGGSRPSGGGGGGGGGSTTTPPPTQTGTPASEIFTDVVKGSWYEAGVTYVVNKGLFKGMSEGVFSPSTNMTRAMVMTVLARMDGQDTTNAVNGPWYANIMNWAMAKGITDGTMPDSSVTREQLVTLLYRYAQASSGEGDLTGFVDGVNVSPYARAAMTWAIKKGIITGKDGARLDPQGTATRAEVATIFQRFVENK